MLFLFNKIYEFFRHRFKKKQMLESPITNTITEVPFRPTILQPAHQEATNVKFAELALTSRRVFGDLQEDGTIKVVFPQPLSEFEEMSHKLSESYLKASETPEMEKSPKEAPFEAVVEFKASRVITDEDIRKEAYFLWLNQQDSGHYDPQYFWHEARRKLEAQ